MLSEEKKSDNKLNSNSQPAIKRFTTCLSVSAAMAVSDFLTMTSTLRAMGVVVLTTVVVQCVRWLLSYRSYFKFYSNLPGETDFHWIWGNLHKVGEGGV